MDTKTELFIEKAKKVHGDKYDYSMTVYENSKKHVTIICKDHGIFTQIPYNHTNGNKCRKCDFDIRSKAHSASYGDVFIEKAKLVHGDTYNYSKVEYVNTDTRVIIICEEHGEFLQTPNNHIAGCGCQKCSPMRLSTTNEFIQKAISVHGDIYNYSKVDYVNATTKIIIICKKHGEFEQTPNSHLDGSSCRRCNTKKILTTEEFIRRSEVIHENEYDYSEVDYVNGRSKVTIICKTHGAFSQTPRSHLYGKKCTKCNSCPSCQMWKTMGKLCEYCDPEKNIKKYQKTKEYTVVKFLKENLPDNEFIHNKSVGNDCTGGHLFPDILFDCGHYNLIIEVDEHKHRGVDYKCDKKRMYEIIAKLGLPCIFIRYNPDGKKSNKDTLLEKVNEYLDMDIEDEEKVWDDFGFKADYLFY